MSYHSDVDDIATIQAGLAEFWSNAHGWAPDDGAHLLASARLDWIPSLSKSLHRWSEPDELDDGDLILAWVNLGIILESSLRLFLGVYIKDYQASKADLEAIDALIKKKGPNQGQPYPPDDLQFEKMRQLLSRKEIFSDTDMELVGRIQSRRNTVHAFNHREIGNASQFREAVHSYRMFISMLASRLPYPDTLRFPWLNLARTIMVKGQLGKVI